MSIIVLFQQRPNNINYIQVPTVSNSFNFFLIYDIGSKLDTDIHLNQCRIAFHGRALHLFANKDFKDTSVSSLKAAEAQANTYQLAHLRVYKQKAKEGVVERMQDEMTVIGKALFKKETNMELFNGLRVTLSTGEAGVIEGSFGQSGKFKVRISGKRVLHLFCTGKAIAVKNDTLWGF